MKIVHVVEDFSEASTGITAVLRQLSKVTAANGHVVEVVTVGESAGPRTKDLAIRTVPIGAPWRYSGAFSNAVKEAVGDGAVLHVHGVWMYPQWRAVQMALSRDWPVVVSSHNMLGGWLWRRGLLRRIKKRIYFELLIRRAFSRVTIHALSETERSALAVFFPRSRIVRIPSAIDLAAVEDEIQRAGASPDEPAYFLFLGRLHPVKGLPVLIDAFRQVNRDHPSCRLIIAGPSDSIRYESELRSQAAGLEDEVIFAGPVYDLKKWHLICGARALCAPSFSEGLSMSALECMAAGVPVITTREAGIDDLEAGGGILVERSAESIARALQQVLSWPIQERRARAEAARHLVAMNYSWAALWPRYEQLYLSAIEETHRP